MKKILSAVCALSLAAAMFTGCGSSSSSQAAASATESDWDYISSKGSMVMGITLFDPMNYYDQDNNLVGFDTELAQAVCEKLGVEAEFVEIDWDNKLMELDSKKVDCIWNGLTIMEDMKDALDYSVPYSNNYQAVVINEKNKDVYTDLESMADAAIGVESGSAGEAAVSNNEFLSQGNVVAVTAQRDNLLELKSGTLDLAVIDAVMARASVGEDTDFADLMVVPGIELSKEEYGIGFRKGSDVVEPVNKALKELAAEGFLDELAKKYLSVIPCAIEE